MADGNDTVEATGSLGGTTNGGSGDDGLLGSATNQDEEFIDGDDGNDTINSRDVGPRFPAGTFPDGTDGFGDALAPVRDFISGGDGSDILVSGNGDDTVDGDVSPFSAASRSSSGVDGASTGADQISTGSGNDDATGGCGDGDVVNLGDGDDSIRTFVFDGNGDVYDGGNGIDAIDFTSISQFGGGGETECNTPIPDGLPFDDFNINLVTGAALHTNNATSSETARNFEDAGTDEGTDTIVGTDASNVIEAGFGNDTVNPGNGADAVVTDPTGFLVMARAGADGVPATTSGNDTVDIADGWNDRLLCGGGADTVQADQFDVDPNQDGNRADSGVSADCEAVTVVDRRAGGADVVAPDCTIRRVKRNYSITAVLRGFSARLTCSEGGRVTVQLLAAFNPRLFGSRAGDVILAERSTTVTAGTAKGVRVKPQRKFRRRLRKGGFRVRLNVEARDQYGNRSVERRAIRVKKAKAKGKRR